MDDHHVMPGRRRMPMALAAASALLLLASACGTEPPPPAAPLSAPPADEGSPAASPPARPGPGRATPAPVPARPGSTTAPIVPAGPVDGGDPGQNAAAYLQGRVAKLVVEIDAVEGKGPRPETVDLLRRRLGAVVDKPGGIRFLPVGSAPAQHGAWSLADLQGAEEASRSTHNTSDTGSLYLLFVDGTPPKEGAIGVAYSASSAAIFSDQIDDAATLLVTAAEIERADTVHEVGHLLSLVNLGYTSSRPREDADHPGHSDNPGSVMYWAVDNVGVASLLGGRQEPPTGFDRDDLADLAAIRSGKAP
jgi:hypothetical protein